MDIQHSYRLAHGRSLGETDPVSSTDLVETRTGASHVVRSTDDIVGHSGRNSEQ